jgi:hypothetical protein
MTLPAEKMTQKRQIEKKRFVYGDNRHSCQSNPKRVLMKYRYANQGQGKENKLKRNACQPEAASRRHRFAQNEIRKHAVESDALESACKMPVRQEGVNIQCPSLFLAANKQY